jgi:hypothetical protein
VGKVLTFQLHPLKIHVLNVEALHVTKAIKLSLPYAKLKERKQKRKKED